MTCYNDEPWCTDFDFDGDFDDQMHDQLIVGYREGVDRVIEFLTGWDDEGELIRDIRGAIEEGII